jgi:hypothetical protein
VAHDPRAPRLAAMATLLAAAGLIVTAVNLNLTLFGSAGLSAEEYGMLAGVAVMLGVRWLANREHEVPEFNPRLAQTNDGGRTLVSLGTTSSGTVNPATASVLTSILGTTATPSGSVDDAMATLGVANTATLRSSSDAPLSTPQLAVRSVEPSASPLDYTTETRAANPTHAEDGRTVQRLVVQPVPLPGQSGEDLRDPTTIPGLGPNREFVTEGVASVPLPSFTTPSGVSETPSPSSGAEPNTVRSDPPPLDLPSIDDLFTKPGTNGNQPADQSTDAALPVDLPSLDDLFTEANLDANSHHSAPGQPSPVAALDTTPALPDLDDMFTNA